MSPYVGSDYTLCMVTVRLDAPSLMFYIFAANKLRDTPDYRLDIDQ